MHIQPHILLLKAIPRSPNLDTYCYCFAPIFMVSFFKNHMHFIHMAALGRHSFWLGFAEKTSKNALNKFHFIHSFIHSFLNIRGELLNGAILNFSKFGISLNVLARIIWQCQCHHLYYCMYMLSDSTFATPCLVKSIKIFYVRSSAVDENNMEVCGVLWQMKMKSTKNLNWRMKHIIVESYNCI